MSDNKRRITVNYYGPDEEGTGARPQFKYLVSASPGMPGTFKVSVTNIDNHESPHAAASDIQIIKADDVSVALEAGKALLDSHHTGLKGFASEEKSEE